MSSWYYYEVCEHIVNTRLHDDIVSYIDNIDPVTECSATKRMIVERLVNVLHHVLANVRRARQAFNQHIRAIDVLHKLRQVDDLQVTSLSLSFCQRVHYRVEVV